MELGPVGDIDGATWCRVLGLAEDEQPHVVIVEGSWWREERTKRRLAGLAGTRELGVPDVHIGRGGEAIVLYACPYGAPRTAEIVHIAALIGVRLAIQLGSCGVIGPEVRPGDVVIATHADGADGVTPLYAGDGRALASEHWSRRAAAALEEGGVTVRRGPIITWPTLFNQPTELVLRWRREGYRGVDMETATTLAVAAHFGIEGTSMLVAWDEVLSGRSFLEPLAPDEERAFHRADEAIYEVALALSEEASRS